ncbi:MAG: bifunctional phosphoserine phosphatase/homoserine phosphotransferase ThrH [Rhodospirillaceae bacterium]|jgi:phosphoserine / homoserine phosphotransferase|nr:bifunctional phosphoserine phosphatase/homoserine phosphotransferase ThrH [Rhodospirillaceae bacterium]MBT4219364.1 bifunctional phosphoserine phosphatase/homoserine phosphotransferase ThrH [Rhodospirillaceae bacterium]MBT4464715.1 bifunctional phosphoserine phosphatase/homoserine phosphotransferase ThrH [Rhodospirillaceae bacterium]MBT7355270.1 bifunctional phosphoserine phosphatase/homoserine phosphotransferase ThrH [Rhodospirillaceae bacterium]
MEIVCLDLEGVLIPEIWIGVAERTGIEALKATTRDIPDYDQLMAQRLDIMDQNNLGIADVQAVIDSLSPLDGAKDFLNWLNERYQVIILSDTFYEFAEPLMRQLDWPTLFCHHLEITDGRISGYQLRMTDHKRAAVEALKKLNFTVYAAGDSYNDTAMLGAADTGFLFCAPDNVIAEFPDFQVVNQYQELQEKLAALSAKAD